MKTCHRSFLCLCIAAAGLASPRLMAADEPPAGKVPVEKLFARENLVAWCIVPFDSKRRGPEERATMLKRLGFKRFAYDYRAEHVPTFDAEMIALKKHGVELSAWWFPTALNDEARLILDVLQRHNAKPQLWVTGGGGATNSPEEQRARVVADAARIRPIAEAAAKIGCTVALYNHGGWFGEPENQIAIINELKLPNVGIVYNQHHGHDHLDRFPELLKKMLPHLWALNLNGMVKNGERLGKKILPLGQGDLDLELLKTIRDSGYRGPIGILGHTQDDAEERLRDNLDGLDWLLPQLAGKPAGPRPKPRTMSQAASPPANNGKLILGEGKFGRALDARGGGVAIAGKDEYRQPPLTLECWAKLPDAKSYNILVAQELKSSATHWELFSMAGSGQLTAYLPGMKPDHVRSSAVVTDGQWHYLAMIFEPARVRLFVDGRQVADQAVEFQKGGILPGDLAIGQLVAREIGCGGWIDDVRLSRGVRENHGVPEKPLAADEQTIGLWRFDAVNDKQESLDESSFKNHGRVGSAGTGRPKNSAPDHFGKEVVGFDWTEQDSVDNRWNQTDVGPFLASTVPIPGQPQPVAKGLSIRIGPKRDATICYDTGQISARAGWFDGFLKFNPARYGIISSPVMGGKLAWASVSSVTITEQPPSFLPSPRPSPGVPGEGAMRYSGLHLHGDRVVLSYAIRSTVVRESPWLEEHVGLRAFTRTFEVDGSPARDLSLPIGEFTGAGRSETIDGHHVVFVEHGDNVLAVALVGAESQVATALDFSRTENNSTRVAITVRAALGTQRFKLALWAGIKADAAKFGSFVKQSPSAENLSPLTKPGPPRWTAEITTRGIVGKSDAPYVLDTLTLPFDNPYKALFFVSGHEFFANGDIALCTVHGDVWRVSGVDERLEKLSWKRFATGLFQPLGLKIVNDVVYVLGRDQITRLHDTNGDGEADVYECFNNAGQTSPGGHDYVACLETDSAGNFYYVHAKQGLVRVSADGRKFETVATGYRNPNGLSIGPRDVKTVSPQEGEWTPASTICEVHPGGFYGYGGPHVSADRPLGYDPPLCWIPRLHDNSSGGQTWVTSDRWGPLAGQLLHFSFGKCRMMLVLREREARPPRSPTPLVAAPQPDGEPAVQGATVDFPLDFESGVMRGRFHPRDGQLYVSGLKGWVSSAVRDGCLQRVRYTGRPVAMPVAMRTLANGIALRFSQPLAPDAAEDPDNFHVQRWNYIYSADYGSPEVKVSDPKQEGRDEVDVVSSTLFDGGHTVFLEIPDLRPAMQMKIGYTLKTAAGEALRQTVHPTIHRIAADRVEENRLHRRARPGHLTDDQVAELRPGIVVRFEQGEQKDVRVDRLFAWIVPAGFAPSAFITSPAESRSFRFTASAFLHVDLKGDYRMGLTGHGDATLSVNGKRVINANGEFGDSAPTSVSLRKGYNEIELTYASPPIGDANCRVWWSSADFAPEPIPPTALFHDGDGKELKTFTRLRAGQRLHDDLRCADCHNFLRPDQKAIDKETPSPHLETPNWSDIGRRLSPDWVYRWLLDPSSLRNAPRMPRSLNAAQAADRQIAADIAVYLDSLRAVEPASDVAPQVESDAPPLDGRILYEDLGCIACHRLTAPAESDENRRQSLHFVAAKFLPGQLANFLLKPQSHYPKTRMPDFRLTVDEAAALAKFLEQAATGRVERAAELKTADPQRGRKLVRELRCVHCHDVSEHSPDVTETIDVAIAAEPLTRGCLAAAQERRGKAPDFGLRDEDQQSLRALWSDRQAFLRDNRLAAGERAEVLLTRLNCAACHARDQRSGALRAIMADESDRGIVPEPLPNLTWTGEKLRGDWLAEFLRGNVAYRPRPWLKGRMPVFPEYAGELALGLAQQHGVRATDDGSTATNDKSALHVELAEIGQRLAGSNGGLDCRQCHAVGRDQPTGDEKTKLAIGINFAHIRERMRPEFYSRFVLDPPRFEINSKMPKLAPDGRTTKATNIFDGDAARQFEALWQYIQTVKMPSE